MNAIISSRTPEGEPYYCSVCGADNRIEPSRPPGDVPCPSCGHLYWFRRGPVISPSEEVQEHAHQAQRELQRHAERLLEVVNNPVRDAMRTIFFRVRRMVNRRSDRGLSQVAAKSGELWDDWLDG